MPEKPKNQTPQIEQDITNEAEHIKAMEAELKRLRIIEEEHNKIVNAEKIKKVEIEQADTDLKNAEKLVEDLKAKLQNARNDVVLKRQTLRKLEGKKEKPKVEIQYYDYDVKIKELEKLFKNQTPIHGISDLFKQVLTIRKAGTNIIDFCNIKYSLAFLLFKLTILFNFSFPLDSHCLT